MTASLSDILTAVKNIVTAINDQSRETLLIAGSQVAAALAAETLVVSGPGRIAVVSVVVAGSSAGMVYDGSAVGAHTLPIYAIPASVGVFVVNLPYNIGLVVKPGTGQTVTVSYSTRVRQSGGQ